MKTFDAQELRRLATAGNGPHVTIYLPARHTGAQASGDITRLKHLLRSAEPLLADFPPELAEATLRPVHALLEDFSFWKDSAHGLVVLASPDVFETLRVPIPLNEQVIVNSCFDLTQLLPLAMENGTFFLLGLDQNSSLLFRMTRTEIEEISLPEEARGLKQNQEYTEHEAELQMHSGTHPHQGERSKRNAIFHGTGSVPDRTKIELEEFMRALDHEVLHRCGTDASPLVLAGVDYLQAIFRGVSRYRHIVETGISGSISRLDAAELHDAAWTAVAPWFDREKMAALRALGDLGGTGLTSLDPVEIEKAAEEGRMKTLLVATANGRNESALHEGGTSLAELIRTSLVHGADIYPVSPEQLPEQSTVAAIMRY